MEAALNEILDLGESAFDLGITEEIHIGVMFIKGYFDYQNKGPR